MALAAAQAHLGRMADARATIRDLLDHIPALTITSLYETTLFKQSGRLAVILDGMRKAGLPEQGNRRSCSHCPATL